MKTIKLLLPFLLLLLIVSCNNDDNGNSTIINQEPDPTTFAENFGNEINRNFLGNVIDKNNNPIEGVIIKIGNSIATTDSNGVFIINDATVNERFGYVTAEKAGYIHGSRAVVPSSGTNKVTIMLLEETVVGTTSSGTAETISLPNGASVSLNGNYIKEDGTEYSGSVNVIMHHLDPADENMQNQMPGMLYAANSENEERMLQTFGMLAVELRGSNGEDLNLATGSTAEIKVPLDASLIADAPSTIPLWYFDETNGYWIEDGEATLIGNAYIGTVSHFSFWTCSVYPIEHYILSVNITDQNSNPLNHLKISLSGENFGTRTEFTNENGFANGLIPANEDLTINIFNEFSCDGNSIYYDLIGSFNQDSTLSITIPNTNNIISENINGSFQDCNESNIDNGYIFITHGSKIFTDLLVNSTFDTNLLRCTDDLIFKVEAIDYESFDTTGEISYSFTTPSTYLGNISSCNDIQEFVSYKIDNTVAFIPYGNNFHLDYNSISGIGISSFGWVYENFAFNFHVINGNTLGFHDENETFGAFIIDPINGSNDGSLLVLSTEDFELTSYVSKFGNVGEFIDVNFEGNYLDENNINHPISGVIHAKRDQ